MKKALVAIVLAAVASTASAAISGGLHDLTSGGGTLAACQYCHAPHWSNNTFAGAPLWNRNVRAASDYTLYSSPGVPTTGLLNAASQTCLSCHDGVTSIGDVYQGADDATKVAIPVGNTNLGTVLTNDHPVSIVYPDTGTDLVDRATMVALPLYQYGAVYYVECATCHDPHVTQVNFLRDTTNICANCHVK